MILDKNMIREECRKRRLPELSDDYLEKLILSAEFHEMWELYRMLEQEERRREIEADRAAMEAERYRVIYSE